MIRIPTVEQIRACEAYTMVHKPISSIELMEIAAAACVKHIKRNLPFDASIAVFCGMGNNGGDGLAITRLLRKDGYKCVPYIVKHREAYSEECSHQVNLLNEQNIEINIIEDKKDIPSSLPYTVVIDALLGIGLTQAIEQPLLQSVIRHINHSNAFVFAIDTPSGLLSEQAMDSKDVVVEADTTLTFQYAKLSFFLAENSRYVGNWKIMDIKLDYRYINRVKINNNLMSPDIVKSYIIPREKFAHKGNFGHGLLIAGSFGMMGAAVLAAKAALRTGIGLLTVNVPKMGYNIMQTSVPEALCRCDENEEHFTNIPFSSLDKYNAVAIGCGIGTHPDTAQGLKKLIGDYGGTLIIDADAINIFAENKTWLEFLPPNSIFTPHHKEFERLVGKASDGYERLKLQREFSMRHHCVVVLKGAYTSISTQQGELYFNPSGNPGMAKGGCGDVLTGMILSLAAQGYSSFKAAVVGAYLHGLSADKAMYRHSHESLLPSDIIDNIGQGFKAIKREE